MCAVNPKEHFRMYPIISKLKYHWVKSKVASETLIKPDTNRTQLKSRFLKALQFINNRRVTQNRLVSWLGGSNQGIRPWILVLGREGNGKSYLIKKSGLNSPNFLTNENSFLNLKDNDKECDWHFFDKIIVLEVPSKYLLDIKSTDSWLDLISLLKSHRKRTAVCSIILTFSLMDLKNNPEKVFEDCHALRERLHEFSRVYRKQVPVHVVFTHIDQITGFKAFSSFVPNNPMLQALKIDLLELATENTTRQDHQDPNLILKEKLESIYHQFHAILLSVVSSLYDETAKMEAVTFPNQFKSRFSEVQKLIRLLIQENSYQITPLISSVSFTGCPNLTKGFFCKWLEEHQKEMSQSLAQFRRKIVTFLMLGFLCVGIFGVYHFLEKRPLKSSINKNSLEITSSKEAYDFILEADQRERYSRTLELNNFIHHFTKSWLTSHEKIESLYTVEAWKNWVQNKIKRVLKDKVYTLKQNANLSKKEQIQKWENLLKQHYFSLYEQAWEKFLSKIQVQPFYNLKEADKRINQFTNSEGVLVEIINLYNTQTKLTKMNNATEGERINAEILKELLNALQLIKLEISQLSEESGSTQELKKYISKVLNSHSGKEETGLKNALKMVNTIRATHEDVKVIIPLFHSIIKETWKTILKEYDIALQKAWEVEIVNFYHKNISLKFPFAESGDDISLEELNNFFHPQEGKIWRFFKDYLEDVLVFEGESIKLKSWMNIEMPLSQEFLNTLRHAKRITNSLYRDGANKPQFSFQVYPIPSPHFQEIDIQVCGQKFEYRNGPEEWVTFHWPHQNCDQGVKIGSLSKDNLKTQEIVEPGVWGLFKMMRNSLIKLNDGALYRYQWLFNPDVNDLTPVGNVEFILKADSKINPVEELLFKQFHLRSFSNETEIKE